MRRLLAGLILGVAFLPAADSGAAPAPAFRGQATEAYSASATGTVVDADVPAGPGTPGVAAIAVATSQAAVNSAGLPVAGRAPSDSAPARPGARRSYGRGAGVDLAVGLGATAGAAVTLAGVAEAAAPPAGPLVTREIGPVQGGPLAYVSLLRAQAEPAWSDRTCVLGRPLGLGVGSVADAQVLSLDGAAAGPFRRALLALDAGPSPGRVVSQSTAVTYLAPNGTGGFALVSEVRQTLAPLTLLKGLPGEVTVEFLGELVLRATAGGRPGAARIEYGPAGDPTPTTPILRILTGGRATELTVQQVFGGAGLTVAANPAVELRIGEAPRPPAGAATALAADGTSASAAVDAIRIRVMGPLPGTDISAVDVRVGHMEARTELPSGGVACPLPVRKTTTAASVAAGEPFGFDIAVPASRDALDGLSCDLVGIRADDSVEATDGVQFALLSASHGGSVSGSSVRWENVGDYHPGDLPKTLTVSGRVDPGSPSGILRDTVVVTADLARCTGGATGQPLAGFPTAGRTALRGAFTLFGPRLHG